MIDKEFVKESNVRKLHDELAAAKFDVIGVSCAGPKTIIHLKDTETKNPKSIVDAHIFTPPETVEDVKARFNAARSTAEKLEILRDFVFGK